MHLIRKFINFIKNDETHYHASSLSFFTIFAITPTLLIIISILTNLSGIDSIILQAREFIFKSLIPIDQKLIEGYIVSFFQNSSKMGAVGLIYIIITSMIESIA